MATASNARLFADALTIFGLARYGSEAERRRVVRYASVALPALSALAFYIFQQPVLLVLIGALGQGLMLPFLGGVALYFHHRRLARTLAAGTLWTICLWLSALAMALVGLYQVAQTFVFS